MSRHLNQVAVAPHGLILGEDEAMASTKPFQALLGVQTAMKTNEITTKNYR